MATRLGSRARQVLYRTFLLVVFVQVCTWLTWRGSASLSSYDVSPELGAIDGTTPRRSSPGLLASAARKLTGGSPAALDEYPFLPPMRKGPKGVPIGVHHLQPSDVVLIMKTGLMVAKRLDKQLTTFANNDSFWSAGNVMVASDARFRVRQYELDDVLAGLLDNKKIADSEQFKPYFVQQELLGAGFDPLADDAQSHVPAGTNNEGWQMDAFKPMPALQLAYNRFPDAKWFFLIDDDTYVHTHNFLHWLDMLDPDIDHWTGGLVPLQFFVHGGGGTVLSRGAMRRRFGTAEEGGFGDADTLMPWIERTLDDGYGDRSLNFAMESPEQVNLKPSPEFKRFFGGKRPAQYRLDSWRACFPHVAWNQVAGEDVDEMELAAAIDLDDDAVLTFVDLWVRMRAMALRKDGREQPWHRVIETDPKATRLEQDLAMLRVHTDEARANNLLYFYPDMQTAWDNSTMQVFQYAWNAGDCEKACRDKTGSCVAWLWLESNSQEKRSHCILSAGVWLPTAQSWLGNVQPAPEGYGSMQTALNVDTIAAWQGRCQNHRWKTWMYTAARHLLRPEYRDTWAQVKAHDEEAWPFFTL